MLRIFLFLFFGFNIVFGFTFNGVGNTGYTTWDGVTKPFIPVSVSSSGASYTYYPANNGVFIKYYHNDNLLFFYFGDNILCWTYGSKFNCLGYGLPYDYGGDFDISDYFLSGSLPAVLYGTSVSPSSNNNKFFDYITNATLTCENASSLTGADFCSLSSLALTDPVDCSDDSVLLDYQKPSSYSGFISTDSVTCGDLVGSDFSNSTVYSATYFVQHPNPDSCSVGFCYYNLATKLSCSDLQSQFTTYCNNKGEQLNTFNCSDSDSNGLISGNEMNFSCSAVSLGSGSDSEPVNINDSLPIIKNELTTKLSDSTFDSLANFPVSDFTNTSSLPTTSTTTTTDSNGVTTTTTTDNSAITSRLDAINNTLNKQPSPSEISDGFNVLVNNATRTLTNSSDSYGDFLGDLVAPIMGKYDSNLRPFVVSVPILGTNYVLFSDVTIHNFFDSYIVLFRQILLFLALFLGFIGGI